MQQSYQQQDQHPTRRGLKKTIASVSEPRHPEVQVMKTNHTYQQKQNQHPTTRPAPNKEGIEKKCERQRATMLTNAFLLYLLLKKKTTRQDPFFFSFQNPQSKFIKTVNDQHLPSSKIGAGAKETLQFWSKSRPPKRNSKASGLRGSGFRVYSMMPHLKT